MKAAGLALVTPDGRALFLQRSGGKEFNGGTWCFPGGKVEEGESALEAALRETQEETGWQPTEGEPKFVHEASYYRVLYSVFRLGVVEEFVPDLGDGEHTAYAWAPLDQPPQPLHPGLFEVLPKVIAMDEQPALVTTPSSGIPAMMQNAEDAKNEPEHVVEIRHNGDFDWPKFLKHLHHLGAIGASRTVTAKDQDDQDIPFGWDGDGADKILSATVNGVDVLADPATDQLPAMDEASVRMYRRGHTVFAFDQQSVRTYDEDGRLHVNKTPISKACVSPYLGREIPDWEQMELRPDKVYFLLRDPDELARGAATFNRIQLLDEHIPVTVDNPQKQAIVGATGSDASFEFPYLFNSLVVWDQGAIEGVESEKKKELSSAYRYRVDWTPGNFKGENYDGIMRDIIANHVSLVKEGRAGPDVVVCDTAEELRKEMKEKTPTRRAATAAGAIAYYVLPFLAKDAKPPQVTELVPAFDGVTAKNWKEQRTDLIKKIGDILKPKFAKDQATPDDVILRLVDMIDGGSTDAEEGLDASVSPEQHNAMEAAAHGHSTLGIPKDVGEEYVDKDKKEGSSDEDVSGKIMQFLQGKVAPEVLEELKKMLGGHIAADVDINSSSPELDNKGSLASDQPPGFKGMPNPGGSMDEEKDMVNKTAMDAAIQAAVKAERANQQATAEARLFVRPYVGDLPLSYDSADAVLGAALKALKINVDGVHPSAYRSILSLVPKPGSKPVNKNTEALAADSANASSKFAERFPDAVRIGIV